MLVQIQSDMDFFQSNITKLVSFYSENIELLNVECTKWVLLSGFTICLFYTPYNRIKLDYFLFHVKTKDQILYTALS